MKKQVELFSRQIKLSSDKLMNYFLAGYFITGLLLSLYYDTWLIGIGVGSSCLLAYYGAKFIYWGSDAYQYVLSVVIGIFMAQFIYQTHGMFEMHFFAFIGSAILVTYRNWKLQIPLAIVVLIHHTVFGYLQFSGVDKIYFTQLDYISIHAFVIHCLLTLVIFSICALWSYNFKLSEETHVKKSFATGKLQEEDKQKAIVTAISETLRNSNELLQEANSELEQIFNTVEEVLFSMDVTNSRIIQISVACKKIYGYTPEEIIADNELWIKVIHPEDRHVIQAYFEKLKIGETFSDKYRIINKDNTIHWIEAKLIPTLNEKGWLVRIDGICNDITEKVKLEYTLAEEKKQRHQQITEAIITAQENERAFLGEELHDNINPILATAKLYLECALSQEDKKASLIKDSKGFIITAIEEIRTLSKKLIAPSMAEVGLLNGIDDMVANLKQVKQIDFITKWENIDEHLLDEKLKLTIFRIIQEQLNNVFKHANAHAVFIGLKQTGIVLELTVKDDGMGFDVKQKRNGVGLQNISSRTALFNGKVLLNAAPGKGCELIVLFNIKPQNVVSINKNLRA